MFAFTAFMSHDKCPNPLLKERSPGDHPSGPAPPRAGPDVVQSLYKTGTHRRRNCSLKNSQRLDPLLLSFFFFNFLVFDLGILFIFKAMYSNDTLRRTNYSIKPVSYFFLHFCILLLFFLYYGIQCRQRSTNVIVKGNMLHYCACDNKALNLKLGKYIITGSETNFPMC